MSKCYKRYEYWTFEDGRAVKKFTEWFKWDSDLKPKYQFGRRLLNEYAENEDSTSLTTVP